MFYYQPHTGRFEQSSRSSVRSSVYSPVYSPLPVRSYDDDMLYVPFRPLYTAYGRYDTTGEENASRSQINRELILSSAAMEDNYDISLRSRNRDKDVLAAANRAIVDTEIHSTPRSAVAARRATRGQSTPPPSTFLSKTEYSPALIKPIHDVDGIKKPSNILSWQYKLDAITSPDDFIIVPRSLSSVKAQLRDAQDKMVKHRQLMDRYLDADTGLTVDDKMGKDIYN